METKKLQKYDVVIIGAGIIGTILLMNWVNLT